MSRSVATKQERADKKRKKAVGDAAVIVGAAVANTEAKFAEWEQERSPDASNAEYAVGCEIRVHREGGMAWWVAGEAVGLGSGKSAGSKARNAYALAFGSYPRTFERNGGTITKAPKVPGVKRIAKSKTRASALKPDETITEMPKPWFTPETSDLVIGAAVANRHIYWMIEWDFKDDNPTRLYVPQDAAVVNPNKPINLRVEGTVDEDGHDNRSLFFLSSEGGMRCCKVRAIYKVGR